MSDTQNYKTVTFDHDEWCEANRAMEERILTLDERITCFTGKPQYEGALRRSLERKASAERALAKLQRPSLSEGLKS